MILKKGDMWQRWDDADLFLITTNGQLSKFGSLVMGAGIAKQAADRWRQLPFVLGRKLAKRPRLNMLAVGKRGLYPANIDVVSDYGLLVSRNWPDAKLGLFQTKRSWQCKSDLILIDDSVGDLLLWCQGHPNAKVCLNFPGIGLGGLSRDEVLPIIESLPDSVEVWEYE